MSLECGGFLVVGYLLGAIPWAGTWISQTLVRAAKIGAGLYYE